MSAHLQAGGGEAAEIARLRGRYLDIVKGALTHMLYRPMDIRWDHNEFIDDDMRKAVEKELQKKSFSWPDVRANGRDWPWFAQTMVGIKRLENVQHCVESVIRERVPGDLIETGVWRGGVVIFMRAVLDAYAEPDRLVFAADSFAGLPPPDTEAFPADSGNRLHAADILAVSRDEVAQNFELYGLLDDRVRFLEGWFKDTLPAVRDHQWSVVRLDGDMYESTMEALENLYPGLSAGGYLIVDDYTFEPCHQAVHDYRRSHGITDPIEEVDWLGAYWRRGA